MNFPNAIASTGRVILSTARYTDTLTADGRIAWQYDDFSDGTNTTSSGFSATTGDTSGDFAVSNFTNKEDQVDQSITGVLTKAQITILGETYDITYQGEESENDGTTILTPFNVADVNTSARQLRDFLNGQD